MPVFKVKLSDYYLGLPKLIAVNRNQLHLVYSIQSKLLKI